jgi:hypothetical protein
MFVNDLALPPRRKFLLGTHGGHMRRDSMALRQGRSRFVVEACPLARRSPKTGKRRSLRAIAAELAVLGHVGPSGAPYQAGSVRHMLGGNQGVTL